MLDNIESDEKELRTILTSWIIRVGAPLLMSIALAISSWFLTQAWNRIGAIEKAVTELQISSATTNGNRFTSTNWVEAKTILDSERLAQDRRIIRLEESLPIIKESLLELRNNMGKKDSK